MISSSVEPFGRHDNDMVEALSELHRLAFPAHMQCTEPEAYFAEAIENGSNLNMVMRNREGAVIGHLLGIPQSHVYAELKKWDPAMRDDPDRIYLDIIQVHPAYRRRSLAYALFQSVCAAAEKRNFFKLSMHARTTTGLNRYLHRIFADIRFLRRLHNWYGCGEPFDYLEATTTLKQTPAGRRTPCASPGTEGEKQ